MVRDTSTTAVMATRHMVFCLFIIIMSSVLFKYAFGLYCYRCGIATDKSDSCNLPPKTSYVVECQANDYCAKTISHRWENDVDKQEETRGCAAPTTFSGKKHELGCHVDQRVGAVVCYCNSDHCNSAISAAMNQKHFSLVITLLVTILLTCWTASL